MKLRTLTIFSLIVLFIAPKKTVAQYSEIGVVLGASNYKGELSPHLFNTDFLNPAAGIFFRHNWNRHWGYKLILNYGKISGDDSKAKTPFELDRNLSFSSTILEFSPQIEFNFFPYETGNSDYPFTPYLFTGISVFHFNPKAELGNTVYELQPLGTEGQGLNGEKKYKRVQIALPIGGGIKISTGRFGIGIELGGRRTYSDYIDDVSTLYPDLISLSAARGSAAALLSDRSFSSRDTTSDAVSAFRKQRGNASDKDWYFFGGVTIYWRLSSLLRDICRPFRPRRYI